jgi:sialate O-acetylesterase
MHALELGSPFQNHAVLQRDLPIPVWGWSEPGRSVVVRFRDQTVRAEADARGAWAVRLNPCPAGGPESMSVEADAALTLTNLLVGDVWLCAGQSNMEWPLSRSTDGAAAAAAAADRRLRLFKVPRESTREARTRCGGAWTECSPGTAGGFSGVAYHFGRELRRVLDAPVGLIQCAWSGATAESFVPLAALTGHPKFSHRLPAWEKYRQDYPRLLAEYEARRAARETEAQRARPKAPDGPETSLAGVYNGMLHPLIPCAIRGVIWYQGENNVLNPEEYRSLFPLLIREWRRRWGQGDFPFLFVQIANFGATKDQCGDLPWPELREAQLSGLAEPNTAMATAIDLGEDRSLHPGNKRDVGLRLARAAKALAYGNGRAEFMGPVFRDLRTDGARAMVRFDHAAGGLKTCDDRPVRGFAVAGEDRNFVPAEAEILGSEVAVWSGRVVGPVAVRYAWADNPDCNLVNAEGLPASPFRSDNWPRAERR